MFFYELLHLHRVLIFVSHFWACGTFFDRLLKLRKLFVYGFQQLYLVVIAVLFDSGAQFVK